MRRCLFVVLAIYLAWSGHVSAQAAASFLDRLEAERTEQTGTAIAIIFDDSGSMAGNKINQAKAAFREWIAKVPANHRLSLTALNAGPLVPLGRDNRPALIAAVNKIQATGGTPLVPNIRRALEELERRRGQVGPYERQIILVFTDGQDTSPEGVPGVQRELEKARRKNVETVGIGYHGEGDYMRDAATRYYNASNLVELQQSLGKVDAEIGDTSDVVVDDNIRAAMARVAPMVSPVAAESAASESAPATPAPPPTAPPGPSAPAKSSSWMRFLVIFGIVFTLGRLLRSRK